jgi:D-alanine-D-alanine ligase
MMKSRDFQVAVLYSEALPVPEDDAPDARALQWAVSSVSAAQYVYDALRSLGYSTATIVVRDSLEELEHRLSFLSPEETFIFNCCDHFCGSNKAAAEVLRLVEQLKFRHTGATARSIELCIDKGRAKQRLTQFNIPTPPYQVFDKPAGACTLQFPVIVKPMCEDASVGIDLNSVAADTSRLFQQIAYLAEEYEQPVLVEEFVVGRELAVAMWGNGKIEVLPIAEHDFSCLPQPLEQLLTFESKWQPESFYAQNIPTCVPAALTLEDERLVREVARSSFHALGLRDFGRVDIRFDGLTPYVIDVNELPDLSPDAGYWHSAQAAGFTYPQMVEHILQLALKREGWLK